MNRMIPNGERINSSPQSPSRPPPQLPDLLALLDLPAHNQNHKVTHLRADDRRSPLVRPVRKPREEEDYCQGQESADAGERVGGGAGPAEGKKDGGGVSC